MRTIIVPTDFSSNAANALRYACRLFKYERSDIHLVHCHDPLRDEVANEQGGAQGQAAVHNQVSPKQAVQALRTRIREEEPNPRHQFLAHLREGMLQDEIDDLAEQLSADVIVMGTRGATNDRSRTFGSNTMHVFRYMKCPVLAIPEGYQYTPPKKILFPSNLMLPFTRRELKLLRQIGCSYRSEIHLLYLDPVERLAARQSDNLRFFCETMKDVEVCLNAREEKDIYEGVNAYMQQQEVDLLVMVNHRHSPRENMLGPSTVDKIGLTTAIPFLVLQNLHR